MPAKGRRRQVVISSIRFWSLSIRAMNRSQTRERLVSLDMHQGAGRKVMVPLSSGNAK